MSLLDAYSKITSVIFSARAQKLSDPNSHPMKIGAVPKFGCPEAVFSLKLFCKIGEKWDTIHEKSSKTWQKYVIAQGMMIFHCL